MICSLEIMEGKSLAMPAVQVKYCSGASVKRLSSARPQYGRFTEAPLHLLLRRPRCISRVLRLPVGVTEVEIAQINRKGHRGAQDADRIPLVNREITQHQQAPQRAALPKAKGNHTFPSAF